MEVGAGPGSLGRRPFDVLVAAVHVNFGAKVCFLKKRERIVAQDKQLLLDEQFSVNLVC